MNVRKKGIWRNRCTIDAVKTRAWHLYQTQPRGPLAHFPGEYQSHDDVDIRHFRKYARLIAQDNLTWNIDFGPHRLGE